MRLSAGKHGANERRSSVAVDALINTHTKACGIHPLGGPRGQLAHHPLCVLHKGTLIRRVTTVLHVNRSRGPCLFPPAALVAGLAAELTGSFADTAARGRRSAAIRGSRLAVSPPPDAAGVLGGPPWDGRCAARATSGLERAAVSLLSLASPKRSAPTGLHASPPGSACQVQARPAAVTSTVLSAAERLQAFHTSAASANERLRDSHKRHGRLFLFSRALVTAGEGQTACAASTAAASAGRSTFRPPRIVPLTGRLRGGGRRTSRQAPTGLLIRRTGGGIREVGGAGGTLRTPPAAKRELKQKVQGAI